jgi:type II secretory pathway pseudopilin PulG
LISNVRSLDPIRCTHQRARAGCTAIRPQEEGYILLTAMFFLALVFLSLAIAGPIVAKSIQRDRDLETFHRGMQYRRAIQLYYRRFHAYPPNVDALVNTNNIKFLRKKYVDPITGKDDWKPVMFGQNKTPTAMGFFGQPLAGNPTTIAGIGPSGGNGLGGTPNAGTPGSLFGPSDSSNTSTGSNGSTTGTSNGTGTSTDNPGTSSTSSSAGSGSGSGTGSSGNNSGSTSSSGSSGQTFGGAGIIGFSPGSAKQSILVYKKKNHYNEWEFTYDPISEMQMMAGGNTGAIGQPASSTSSPIGNSPMGNNPSSTTNTNTPSTGPGSNPTSTPTSP